MAVKFDANDVMFTVDSARDEEKETGSQVEAGAGTQEAVETWRTCCPGASGGWRGCCPLDLLQEKDRGQPRLLPGRGRQDEDSRGRAEAGLAGTRRGRYSLDQDLEMATDRCLHPSQDSVSSTLSSCSGTRF